MKIFVTGASGWIGSTTITALKAMGHDVSGLARSPHSAERVASLGATVVMGSLEEGDVLRAAAEDADATNDDRGTRLQVEVGREHGVNRAVACAPQHADRSAQHA